MLLQDKHFGFVVLNKPGGVPAHATVDNGSENALSMFQADFASQTKNVPSASDVETTELGYASLPQRLDTETSGLMMIATKKEFSTYISKMLEQKTADHTQHDLNGKFIQATPAADITKQYRCLVCLSNKEQWHELEKLSLEKTVVTHYLDFKSAAPKTFVSHLPLLLEGSSDQDSKSQWLQCKLRITRVGDSIPLLVDQCYDEASMQLVQNLWRGGHSSKPASCRSVVELEVELLTGRTHQIRGQLKGLGCPIVGDPLYGGGGGDLGGVERMRSADSMALQCCALQFPHPKWAVVAKKNGKGHHQSRLAPSEERCSFFLDRAWWTQYVDQCCNDIKVDRRKVTAGLP
jgi:23S rRNA-/tRNA-specific pseudouridylate synthase